MYTEQLTSEQHKFRLKAIAEIMQFIRERNCCAGVMRDSGEDFKRMEYKTLCEYYEHELERIVPSDALPVISNVK